MTTATDLRTVVDWQAGRIAPAIYFDEDIYRQEQRQIFGRAWLPIGHESMVAKAGDYATTYMGEVPVIVIRDRETNLHVLVNKCAHRGNQVCLFDRGNVRSFTCSYHGWTYAADGRLIGVPMEKPLYRNELDKASWGLEKARVATFQGLLFATFDPHAPPLDEWLGDDVRWWLENFVLAAPLGGLESLPGYHRYRSPGNWKLLCENFIGDNYHVPSTHASVMRLRRDLADDETLPFVTANRRARHYEGTCGYKTGCPLGLGMVLADDESAYNQDLAEAKRFGSRAVKYVRERRRLISKLLTEFKAKPYGFVNGLLFPNLGMIGFMSAMQAPMFLQCIPRGPVEHEVWQSTMVEREAPEAVREFAVQRAYQTQYMGGVFAPDDVENFERISHASEPRRNWWRPFNYELQVRHETEVDLDLPGLFGPEPSEVNQRQFYRFWLELMEM